MAKTPLTRTAQRALQLALRAEQRATADTAAVVEEALATTRRRTLSRRDFLTHTAGAALAYGILPRRWHRAVQPRIAIVGAGLAGLNALHHLKKKGLNATVYESSGRTGGRMFTVQEAMGPGTWTEYGGEFVDTSHKEMWNLIDEFGLQTIDLQGPTELPLTQEMLYFGGQRRTMTDLVAAFRAFAPRLQADQQRIPDDLSYRTRRRSVRRLDRQSVSEYLEKIGATGWVRSFLETAYETEYGLEASLQSSLNLLLYISPDTTDGELALYGDSDERYKVRGGNQTVPDRLAQQYAAHIVTGRTLESLRSRAGGGYTLHFAGQANDVVADYVVLTLPFTRLRQVELGLEMPAVKKLCINELSYGANAKMMLGMNRHVWREQGSNGLVFSDNGVSNGWDNAQLQTPDSGAAGLSILLGGQAGRTLDQGTSQERRDHYLARWEQIFPGVRAAHNDRVARMQWLSYPHNLGGYTCPTVGQYTRLIGAEQMPVGDVFFAGEHCGGESQGYMNGAALSGREAAEAILRRVD